MRHDDDAGELITAGEATANLPNFVNHILGRIIGGNLRPRIEDNQIRLEPRRLFPDGCAKIRRVKRQTTLRRGADQNVIVQRQFRVLRLDGRKLILQADGPVFRLYNHRLEPAMHFPSHPV